VSRIKINLASGNVIDKPLITCFKGTNGDYLVLDNETNGSMGLPIICISKLNGTTADKIVDQNEWAAVKDNLKTIIAGTALPYLPVPEVLNAQDDFFTQLTLPVASFDLLKSVYQPVTAAPAQEMAAPVAPIAPVVPTASVVPPVVDAPVIPSPAAMTASDPVVQETSPVMQQMPMAPMQEMAASVAPIAPVVHMDPVVPPVVDAPVIPTPAAPVASDPVVSAPLPVIEPVVPQIPPVMPEATRDTEINDDITTIKENFMKSCETMFDALIKKFENK